MQSILPVVLVGVVCGGVLSLLSPLSSMINKRLGVIESIFIVHVSGLAAGIAFLLVSRGGLGNLAGWSDLTWYQLAAGVLGLSVIGSYTYTIPRVGVAASVLITVTAQLGVSAFLDHFGFLGADIRPITLLRLLGIMVMFLGVWLMMRDGKKKTASGGKSRTLGQDGAASSGAAEKADSKLWSIILVVLVGMVGGASMGLQSPLYSMINQQLGTAESVVIVHVGGAIAALFVLLVVRRGSGKLGQSLKLPWYLLMAGMLGVVVISAYSFMIPRIGVTTSVLITVTTQMGFSSILDHNGFLGADVRRMNVRRLMGIVVMFLGVWLTIR